MKNFTRKKAVTVIKEKLNGLIKQGFNTDDLLKEKTVEKWGWTQQSLDEFNKRVKRIRQRPQIEKEVKEYDERVRLKQIRQIKTDEYQQRKEFVNDTVKKNKDILNDTSKAIMKFNHEDKKPTPQNIYVEAQTKIEDFLKHKYFKSTSNYKLNQRIDKMVNRFGSRLDLVNSFIDQVNSIDFKYEIDGVIFDRQTFASNYADRWDDMMEKRLEAMEGILKTKDYRL